MCGECNWPMEDKNMQLMTCTTCNRVIQTNNTGICLGCQRGFPNVDQEDIYKPPTKNVEDIDKVRDLNVGNEQIKSLEDRKDEIENLLEDQFIKPVIRIKKKKK